jgi:hypothetical protein
VPTGVTLDLEHRPGQRAEAVARPGRQHRRDRLDQCVDPCAGAGGAGEGGVHQGAPGVVCQGTQQPAGVGPGAGDELVEQRRLVLGQHVDRTGRLDRWADRHDSRGEPVGDLVDDAGGVGSHPVDLVDEQQRRDVQALERPEQDPRLGLDTLDGRHHEDGPVEHAQHPVDLGDEVGVARRVDQVDRDAADHEGDHRRADGDAPAALQVERVGLRVAVIDAAHLADDPGGEEEPLGQAGLAGVNMRQDSQVERVHGARCPPSRRRVPAG